MKKTTYDKFTQDVLATTTTVIGYGRLEIIAPAKPGQRIYVVSASSTTDVDDTGSPTHVHLQDATANVIACVTTATSTTVTSAALFGPVEIAMKVTGTGIPANTYVGGITDASTITITQAASATGTPNLTFSGSFRFSIKSEPRADTFVPFPFMPQLPVPISAPGSPAMFWINCTTTGRLSVAYLYGP